LASYSSTENDYRGRRRSDPDDEELRTVPTAEDMSSTSTTPQLSPTQTTESIPSHPVADSLLAHFAFSRGGRETPAQRRRREVTNGISPNSNIIINPTAATSVADSLNSQTPTEFRARGGGTISPRVTPHPRAAQAHVAYLEEPETAAERRRRRSALGIRGRGVAECSDEEEESDTDSEDYDGTGFRVLPADRAAAAAAAARRGTGTSADGSEGQGRGQFGGGAVGNGGGPALRLKWGEDVGKRPEGGQ
jgi:hypothetical protein